jgi:hypothetical protein
MKDVPDFKTWGSAALIAFCEQAYSRMQTDQEEITSLKGTVKDAIQAYRTLIIIHEKETK